MINKATIKNIVCLFAILIVVAISLMGVFGVYSIKGPDIFGHGSAYNPAQYPHEVAAT
jgi:hypothetical protein